MYNVLFARSRYECGQRRGILWACFFLIEKSEEKFSSDEESFWTNLRFFFPLLIYLSSVFENTLLVWVVGKTDEFLFSYIFMPHISFEF